MIIHPEPQGTLEWLSRRAGCVTASEFSELVDTKFEPRTGEMPRTLLARKLAERWLGGPLPGFSTIDMDIGKILEEECLPFLEFTTGIQIQRVGLLTTDDGRIGCSPDGLIGEDGGVEAKCPRSENHLKYLLAGDVPKDYLAQVHGSMFVTGRPWWNFVSYARHFPPLILRVERDEKIQALLGDALAVFLANLEKQWARLCEINGGPPQRRKSAPIAQSEPEFVSECPT